MTIGIPQIVDGAIPAPRPYNLLTVIGAPLETGERWIGGTTVDRYRIGPATVSSLADCNASPPGGDVAEADRPPGPNTADTDSFQVSAAIECNGQALTDFEDFVSRLSTAVEAVEIQAAEMELYSADATGAASLRSTAQIADTGAHTLVEGLGVLEQVFGEETAIRGVLHLSDRVAVHLFSKQVLRFVSNHVETVAGTPVVISAGYDGSMPLDDDGSTRDGADSNGTGEEYIYMSGMLQLRRSELWVPEADPSEALRRSDNLATVHTERWYNIMWDHDAVWALQVTRPAV